MTKKYYVPIKIARAAAIREDFDKLVAEHIRAGLSITRAYYAAEDDVQEFMPDWQRYPNHMSYFMHRRRLALRELGKK